MEKNPEGRSIVILVDDYLPDSTKVAAKMMHELAVEICKRNFNVIVVTPSASLSDNSYETERIEGVQVIRFKSGSIKNCSFIRRAINESLLSLRAAWSTVDFFKQQNIALIISYSPSIFWGRFAIKLKMQFNCPVYLILRDFFPQWIIDHGLVRETSPVVKYFRYFETLNYQSATVIGIQSQANINLFKRTFGDKYSTRLLYNWARPEQEEVCIGFKKKLKIENKILFFYGGNIGKAQDMANLVRLAKRLRHHPQAYFVFLGQGDEVQLIREMIRHDHISNIALLPAVSQQEFKAILLEVDIGLFSLSRVHASHNFPGKLLGYMVNHIPILGSVNDGNDLQTIITEYQAGFVTVNGEDDLLYQNALTLLEDASVRKQAGMNAAHLLQEKFTVNAAADEVLSILIN